MKLEIKGLSKNYGNIQALNHVNLELTPGIYGLLGPNGAGKSTLINLLTDNVRREVGDIFWDGTEILRMGKEYRRLLGYMPQQQGCYDDFSAEAFLVYMCLLKGFKKKEALHRIDEMLNVVNLKEYRYEKVGAFSGGMKQRLLLAQALIGDPKIVILDEPTAGVDPQERIHIRNFISEIASDKIVLLATHIVSDVEAIAKEIILLKKGEVINSGKPYELIDAIKSKVYEIHIPQNKLREIQDNYTISNIQRSETGFAVKVIAHTAPEGYLYNNITPNLEDVYLYYFGG